MQEPFTHSAGSLGSFFSQPGRGFYIPYYQRQYSWDKENAEKLVTDIFYGIKRTITKSNNSLFLGTVILHNEKQVTVHTHTDTPNLLTKVSNVVDGQQRIASIAMLACVLSHCVSKTIGELKALTVKTPDIDNLVKELTNELPHLREFYSVEVKQTDAQPPIKPLIIRAGEVETSPRSDQWTLAGDGKSFYRSNTASFLSEFINNGTLVSSPSSDDRVRTVVEVFLDQIERELEEANLDLAESLLAANRASGGSLYNFIAYPPEVPCFQTLEPRSQGVACAGMLLLAASFFLKNSCHLVVIECGDLDLAFDMFQSLNATGTPLTAFEVFKPQLVKAWEPNYASTIKPEVDRIERVFETESTASGKEALTDRVIVSTALIYNGQGISKQFSRERDWLADSLPNVAEPLSRSFVVCIADQAEYCQRFVISRKPAKNSSSFELVEHLCVLGVPRQRADEAALCVFYLRDAGHEFANSVLSVFYSKLLRSQGSPALVNLAAAEFVEVCKATAAFFTLWMGVPFPGHPDSVYKRMFQSGGVNMTVANGIANQSTSFVKSAFKEALALRKIYDTASATVAKPAWVAYAKGHAWYAKKAVCRFALFVASHDAAADFTATNEGFFTDGLSNSASLLNCRAWHAADYEVIEHVATRDKPRTPVKYPTHCDPSIYPGNRSVVDKLGNLSLLSVAVNSSVYSEWPDKVFYYWSLTTSSSTLHGLTGTQLQAALGISSLPPSLGALVAASNCLPHLAPLAYRGAQGLKWDAAFIDRRSEHLCERVFDKLDAWLR